jgi:tetratricopeptide (TPR) repeat protein
MLPLLLFLAPAAAAEAEHAAVARGFLEAFRAGDERRMSVLAARPATEVAYTLAVYSLLRGGEPEAAARLAELRGGPEREGLLRLVETYRSGAVPAAAQLDALERARARLEGGEGAAALADLRDAGEPPAGTLLAVEVRSVRARAYEAEARGADAAREWGGCATAAIDIGWLDRARAARTRQLALAPTPEVARNLVELQRLMDDRSELVNALAREASVLLAAKEPDPKAARERLLEAVHLARQLEDRLRTAGLLGQLAMVTHDRCGMSPKLALGPYRESIELYRALGVRSLHAQATFLNAARAHSGLAQYAESMGLLDELLGWPPDEAVRRQAVEHRAYVLRRQGRLEKSLAAYGAALEAAQDPAERVALHLSLGQVQQERFDLASAVRHYDEVLRAAPDDPFALAGRAACLQDVPKAVEGFDAAVRSARDPAQRRQILSLKAAFQRSYGLVADARASAEAALEGATKEEASAAVTWQVLADLALVDRDYDRALPALANASVLFFQMNEPRWAVPAYLRETLVLTYRGKFEEAERRLVTLKGIAAGMPDDSLKAMAARADATFAAFRGRREDAIALFNDAFDLAAKGGDVPGQATALVHRAILEPAQGHAFVRKALGILDERPEEAPLPHPFVEGEHPRYACSIGVRALLDSGGGAAEAYPLMERARLERLQLALRGREALLAAALPEDLHRDYVARRGRLREARVEGQGVEVEEAERGFRGMVARLRLEAPRTAAIAFPEPLPIERVQAALEEDEALLLFLADEYAQAVLLVDRGRAVLARPGKEKRLEPVAALLEGKRRIFVAPDDLLALETPAEVRYVPSATIFAMPSGGGKGSLSVDEPLRADLTHPQASTPQLGRRFDAAAVVLRDVTVARGPRPCVDGLSALVAGFWLGGADRVELDLDGRRMAWGR